MVAGATATSTGEAWKEYVERKISEHDTRITQTETYDTRITLTEQVTNEVMSEGTVTKVKALEAQYTGMTINTPQEANRRIITLQSVMVSVQDKINQLEAKLSGTNNQWMGTKGPLQNQYWRVKQFKD